MNKKLLKMMVGVLTVMVAGGYGIISPLDAAGSQDCLSSTKIEVDGTAVICPGTAQERTVSVTGYMYVATPVECPTFDGGGGDSEGVAVQSSGGKLPSGSTTSIVECFSPPWDDGTPDSDDDNDDDCDDECETEVGAGPSPGGSTCTGSKVEYVNGTYTFSVTDLRVPTSSFGLGLVRTYGSNRVVYDSGWKFDLPEDGPLGYGWTSPYFVKVLNDIFIDANGRSYQFTRGSDGKYLTDMKDGFTLTQTMGGGYELASTDGWTFVFNSEGKPTSLKDRTGNTSYLNYTGGKLTSVTDAMGREVMTFIYNADGRIMSATDLSGRTTGYEYDAYGNLVTVTDVLGNETTYAYNSYHCMTSKTDPGGDAYAIEYDPSNLDRGIVKTVMDPAGNTTEFQYDFTNRVFYMKDYAGTVYKMTLNTSGSITSKERVESSGNVAQKKVEFQPGNIVKKTDEAGNVTTEHWDERGNVTSRVDGEGNTWTYTYSDTRLLTSTNPLGVTDKYDYDVNGLLMKETLASGTADEFITTHEYDGFGRETATTRGGARVEYTYNEAGKKVSTKDPLGNVSRMEYDDAGNMTAALDPLGNRTEYTYDAAGNMLTSKDAIGNVTTNTYDADGRVITSMDAKGNVTKYEYDFKGHVTKMVNALNQGVTMEYDAKGNVIKSTDLGELNENGQDADTSDNVETNITYDTEGRKTSVTDAAGNVTKYEYNGAGCGCAGGTSASTPAKITDPFGKVTENTFDNNGKVVSVTDPMGHVSYISYDAAGRVKYRTDANSKKTTYEYDNLGRMVKQTDAADGMTVFAYDSHGNLATVTDAEGHTTAYEYDLAGHKTKETRPMGQYASFTYDAAGNLKTKTDAKGQVTTYNYDKLNRLVEVKYADDGQETYSYDERGALVGYTGAANGTMTYDVLGRKLTETTSFGLFSKGYSYGYDAHGNKASYTAPDGTAYSYGYTSLHQPSSIGWTGGSIAYTYQWNRLLGQTLSNGIVTGYTYNDNGWLTGIAANASTGGTVMDYSYQFDSVGNITGRTTEAGSYAYSYDDVYRLTNAARPALAAETFGYDKVGNRLSSADYTDWSYNSNNALIGYDGVSYTYDPNGNTTRKSVSGQDTVFTYSAADRLEQVNLTDGGIAVYMYDPFGRRVSKTVDGVTTYFMYADEGLVAEMDAAGNIVVSYGWRPNSTWSTSPVFMSQGGQTYFYHNDHLGTPQKMTNAAGAVVWSAAYTSFGEAAVDSASTITNNLRFPGQYYDAETGLHYNFHRYYDPKTGRYVTEDPIGLKGDINNYMYANNNAIKNIDNKGLFSTAEAVWHYLFGNGDEIIVDFSEVDIGLQPADFPGYNEIVKFMYKTEGTLGFSLNSESIDIGAWAGHQTYRLKGTIKSDKCGWSFEGYIGAWDNAFDFNELPEGEREWYKEDMVRAINKMGKTVNAQDYNITFNGHRLVEDGGKW